MAIKIARLQMSTKEEADIKTLRNEEMGFETGEMGDCFSVIVLWGKRDDGAYANAKAQHAAGGIGNINWELLLEGVPNDCSVVGCTSASNLVHEEEKFNDAVRDHSLTGHSSAYGYANAYIDRKGLIFNATEEPMYSNLRDPKLYEKRL